MGLAKLVRANIQSLMGILEETFSPMHPMPTNSFTISQSFPVYLKTFISIKRRGNKAILGNIASDFKLQMFYLIF